MNSIPGYLSRAECQYKALLYFPVSGVVLLFLWFWRAEKVHIPQFWTYTIAIILLLLMFGGTLFLYVRCFRGCYLQMTKDGLLFSAKEGGQEAFLNISAENILSFALRSDKDATVYIFTVKEKNNSGYIFRRRPVDPGNDLFRTEFEQAFPHIEKITD